MKYYFFRLQNKFDSNKYMTLTTSSSSDVTPSEIYGKILDEYAKDWIIMAMNCI